MMQNGRMVFLTFLMLFSAGHLQAADQQDVRRVDIGPPELKVIEEKCLICHNHQRIDAARRERRNVEGILRKMESKGVKLTTKDRQVIGHFLSSPFKGESYEGTHSGKSPPK